MVTPVKFIEYKHHLVVEDNKLITRKFICLLMSDDTLRFTNFHRYAKNPNRKLKHISENSHNRISFINQMLNYAFFHRGLCRLSDITPDIICDFFNDFGRVTLPGDDEYKHRQKGTVLRCVNVILDFFELYLEENKNANFKVDDLFTYVERRNDHGKIYKTKVPRFEITYTKTDKAIFRDLPNKVFEVIFSHIMTHHPELLALISLSAFAGLRPSESCNVRRPDSPLGPGIIFTEIDGKVIKAEIDLREIKPLRSDLKPLGGIKKKRMQRVPDIFLEAFVDSYNTYMQYMNGRKYEKEYGALTVNKQGKAYTYDSYRNKFSKILKNEIIPILLKDEDPEITLYGRILLENNLTPHVFRHWYTVQLVLSGISEPGILMKLRGDSNPESSLHYIQDKSDLEKQFRKVSNNAFEDLYMKAEYRKENKKND